MSMRWPDHDGWDAMADAIETLANACGSQAQCTNINDTFLRVALIGNAATKAQINALQVMADLIEERSDSGSELRALASQGLLAEPSRKHEGDPRYDWRERIRYKLAEDAKTGWIYRIDEAGNGCRYHPDGGIEIVVDAKTRMRSEAALLEALSDDAAAPT